MLPIHAHFSLSWVFFYFCIATTLCGLSILRDEHNTRHPDVSSKTPHKQGWKVSRGPLENIQWCHTWNTFPNSCQWLGSLLVWNSSTIHLHLLLWNSDDNPFTKGQYGTQPKTLTDVWHVDDLQRRCKDRGEEWWFGKWNKRNYPFLVMPTNWKSFYHWNVHDKFDDILNSVGNRKRTLDQQLTSNREWRIEVLSPLSLELRIKTGVFVSWE